jgi:hypothetical protein
MVFIITNPDNETLPHDSDLFSKVTFHLNGLWQLLDIAIPSAAEEALLGRECGNQTFGFVTGHLTYRQEVGVVAGAVDNHHDDDETEWFMRASSIKNIDDYTIHGKQSQE